MATRSPQAPHRTDDIVVSQVPDAEGFGPPRSE